MEISVMPLALSFFLFQKEIAKMKFSSEPKCNVFPARKHVGLGQEACLLVQAKPLCSLLHSFRQELRINFADHYAHLCDISINTRMDTGVSGCPLSTLPIDNNNEFFRRCTTVNLNFESCSSFA